MSEWSVYGKRRRDKAEPGVIATFKAAGASVLQLTGKDVPDLAVGWAGYTFLVEVKSDNAKLRPGQAALAAYWKGSPIAVARTPAQARKLLKLWTARATTLSSLLRAQRDEAERGGGVDAAIEDHEDATAEKARTA